MVGVVGSTNVDVVLKVERFTLPGQTQRAISVEKFPGGKGANQAVTVAKLSGGRTVFITLLGDDEDGKEQLKRFEDLGIRGPKIVKAMTGRAFIELTSDGQNRIIIHGGANDMLTPEKVNWEMLRDVDIVLLQNEIPFRTTLEVAMFAKDHDKTVIFDPAPASGIDPEVFRYVDYITPNETELEELAAEIFGRFDGIEESVNEFLDFGLKNVIVKLGSDGIYYTNGLKEIRIPAPRVEAVDTTAAGDVFNGAFAVALDSGKGLLESLRFAVHAASLSVTREGAQTSIPDMEEVRDFERRLGESQD